MRTLDVFIRKGVYEWETTKENRGTHSMPIEVLCGLQSDDVAHYQTGDYFWVVV
jgi:hypothetical protein